MNSKKIKKQAAIIVKQGNEIAELRKHIEEYDAKLRDIQEKISKAQDLPSTSVLGTFGFIVLLHRTCHFVDIIIFKAQYMEY